MDERRKTTSREKISGGICASPKSGIYHSGQRFRDEAIKVTRPLRDEACSRHASTRPFQKRVSCTSQQQRQGTTLKFTTVDHSNQGGDSLLYYSRRSSKRPDRALGISGTGPTMCQSLKSSAPSIMYGQKCQKTSEYKPLPDRTSSRSLSIREAGCTSRPNAQHSFCRVVLLSDHRRSRSRRPVKPAK
jgi:hypothetical protein